MGSNPSDATMSDKMIDTVFQEVLAALLNSECEPKEAVIAALRAVNEFATNGAGIEDLLSDVIQVIQED